MARCEALNSSVPHIAHSEREISVRASAPLPRHYSVLRYDNFDCEKANTKTWLIKCISDQYEPRFGAPVQKSGGVDNFMVFVKGLGLAF